MFNPLKIFFKKKEKNSPEIKTIITEEDARELKEIQRKTYMDEARKLMVERGKIIAKQQLEIKQKEDEYNI